MPVLGEQRDWPGEVDLRAASQLPAREELPARLRRGDGQAGVEVEAVASVPVALGVQPDVVPAEVVEILHAGSDDEIARNPIAKLGERASLGVALGGRRAIVGIAIQATTEV